MEKYENKKFERHNMKKKSEFFYFIRIITSIFSVSLICSGCATQKIAEGLTTKNISGNGMFAETNIGLNLDTKIPEIRTVFVDGDISTAKAGTNQITYREESSASIWNAKSITKKRFISITLAKTADIPAVIKVIQEIIQFSQNSNPDAE